MSQKEVGCVTPSIIRKKRGKVTLPFSSQHVTVECLSYHQRPRKVVFPPQTCQNGGAYGEGSIPTINFHLQSEFSSDHPLDEMARYHLQSGGKSLRGRLALAEAESKNYSSDKALVWAKACELLHNATLIHDDIQDKDPIRRGQASVWKKYGVEQAINLGDYLIFRTFKLTASLGSPLLIEKLADTSEILVRGQAKEIQKIEWGRQGYWPSYLKMCSQKTGTLFKLPVEGIQTLMGFEMSPSEEETWYSLGICYQIYDDIRDFLGLKQKGQIQKDLVERKITAPLAWLSKNEEHFDLLESYWNLPVEHPQHIEILKKIKSLISEKNILQQLTQFSSI